MINMKRYLLPILLLIPILVNARAPEWVNSIPNNSFYYWGIGVCDLSNLNYKEVAKKEAIESIAQQISVKIESNSFLELSETMTETSGIFQEYFQKQTQYTTQNYLQELQIFDTYQDKKYYYICYRLEKAKYNAHIHAKSEEVARLGYDYLQQARQAEMHGNLVVAISFYQKGLEAVEDWLFLDLTYMSENVPVSLHSGFVSIFEGLTISLSPQTASVQNFKELNIDIVATLKKKDTAIKNIPLVATFTLGSGRITTSAKTNDLGEGHFFLTQLSSKDAMQTITIGIDKSIIKNLPQIYQTTDITQRFPEGIFRLNVEQQRIVFYINSIYNDMPDLVKQISSVLVTDNFEITTNMEDATHIIDFSTNLKKGGIVNGDLENLSEWFASLEIVLKDKDKRLLMQYTVDDVRVLVSEAASRTVVVQQSTKEIMKRFKREFPQKLSKVNIR